jgi:Pyruvoyl-dependent arginine decarboxylase (PvlArgDC)
MYGYIAEHHGSGMTADQSDDYAEDLAASMLASTLGIDFDPSAAWNEREKLYEHTQLIIESRKLRPKAMIPAYGPAWLRRPYSDSDVVRRQRGFGREIQDQGNDIGCHPGHEVRSWL